MSHERVRVEVPSRLWQLGVMLLATACAGSDHGAGGAGSNANPNQGGAAGAIDDPTAPTVAPDGATTGGDGGTTGGDGATTGGDGATTGGDGATTGGDGSVGGDAGTKPPSLRVVGHDPLMNRGMNAALAVWGNYAYVGSRTDAGPGHPNPGVLVVDISNPAAPSVVGEIGPPQQGLAGISSRELRIWPQRKLLIVLNIQCDRGLHACGASAAEASSFKFYDLANPAQPQHVATYFPSSTPHEFFLWQDPANPDRALLYATHVALSRTLQVHDISDPKAARQIAAWDPASVGLLDIMNLHSVSVDDDGKRAYLSHQSAGPLIVDTSALTGSAAAPQITLLTQLANRIDPYPPRPPALHSIVPIPGRNLMLATEEVYPPMSCPWGWMWLASYDDPARATMLGEYKAAENELQGCQMNDGPSVSFTSHNPTVTENLAFVTWHSAGLHAIDTSDPAKPVKLAELRPDPVASVMTEDPALGGNPVLAWSYPIFKDGLIYYVDIRNGLYVIEYVGPFEEQVRVRFREGNSNIQ